MNYSGMKVGTEGVLRPDRFHVASLMFGDFIFWSPKCSTRRVKCHFFFILPHMNDLSDRFLQCNSAEWGAPYSSAKFWQ